MPRQKVLDATVEAEAGSKASSWANELYETLMETKLVDTVSEAVRAISTFNKEEWDQGKFDRQMATFELSVKITLKELSDKHDEPAFLSYNLEYAKALHANSLEDPPIYRMCSGVMVSPKRRKKGGGVSEEVKAALTFYKFLMAACWSLPDCLRVRSRVMRGVKWVYPSPDDHNPEEHFSEGKIIFWYEPKSTSSEAHVMYQDTFCGHHGPRTIFTVDTDGMAFNVCAFSEFEEEEAEVLMPLITVLQVVDSQKLCDHKKVKDPKGGFPDAVRLKQIHVPALDIGALLGYPVDAPSEKSAAGAGYAVVKLKKQGSKDAFRAELVSKTLKDLKAMAREAGITEEYIDNALDDDDPKEVLINGIVAKFAAKLDAEQKKKEAFRSELLLKKVKDLKVMAREEGLTEEDIDNALDNEDPKETLIDSIIAQIDAKGDDEQEEKDSLHTDLLAKPVKDLKVMAREAGLTEEDIDEALDHDDPKQVLVDKILAQADAKVGATALAAPVAVPAAPAAAPAAPAAAAAAPAAPILTEKKADAKVGATALAAPVAVPAAPPAAAPAAPAAAAAARAAPIFTEQRFEWDESWKKGNVRLERTAGTIAHVVLSAENDWTPVAGTVSFSEGCHSWSVTLGGSEGWAVAGICTEAARFCANFYEKRAQSLCFYRRHGKPHGPGLIALEGVQKTDKFQFHLDFDADTFSASVNGADPKPEHIWSGGIAGKKWFPCGATNKLSAPVTILNDGTVLSTLAPAAPMAIFTEQTFEWDKSWKKGDVRFTGGPLVLTAENDWTPVAGTVSFSEGCHSWSVTLGGGEGWAVAGICTEAARFCAKFYENKDQSLCFYRRHGKPHVPGLIALEDVQKTDELEFHLDFNADTFSVAINGADPKPEHIWSGGIAGKKWFPCAAANHLRAPVTILNRGKCMSHL